MGDEYTLRTSDVARMLALSVERVRQMDHELLPVRDIGSRQRRYSLENVRAVRSKRAQRAECRTRNADSDRP